MSYYADDREFDLNEQVRMENRDMDEIKLCCNCAHFVAKDEFCGRSMFMDYVHGKHRFFGAMTERGPGGDCGPEAKFFEPINDKYVTHISTEYK